MMSDRRPTTGAIVLAWGVHAYTALGLLCAAAMAVLIVRGGDEAFRLTFLLMILATVIDSTDGWLARRARVSEVLPRFDGRRLDDLIDYLTYTCLPLLLIWRAGLVGGAHQWWLVVPLIASAYGFSQTEAKTEDHFFLGFPSYWNVVAFYLYLLRLPEAWALATILAFAVLTFVPARYLHASYPGRWTLVTTLLGVVWTIALLATIRLWRATPRAVVLASLAYPAYYLGVSWLVSLRRALSRRQAASERERSDGGRISQPLP